MFSELSHTLSLTLWFRASHQWASWNRAILPAALTSAAHASSVTWAILDAKLFKDSSWDSWMGLNPSCGFWPVLSMNGDVWVEGGLGHCRWTWLLKASCTSCPASGLQRGIGTARPPDLVDAFSLAIHLEGVGCGGHNFNPEYLAESAHEA